MQKTCTESGYLLISYYSLRKNVTPNKNETIYPPPAHFSYTFRAPVANWLLLLACACLVLFTGCKEDENSPAATANSNSPDNAPQLRSAGTDMYPDDSVALEHVEDLLDLANRTITPSTYGNRTVAHTLWVMEATANYEYGIVDTLFHEIKLDTLKVSLRLDASGKVDAGDIQRKYWDLQNRYGQTLGSGENWIVIDGIEFRKTSSKLDLHFIGWRGIQKTTTFNCPLTATDPDYYWGMITSSSNGICDGSGTDLGNDLDDIIEWRVNDKTCSTKNWCNTIAGPTWASNVQTFYYDPTVQIYPNPNDSIPNDNYRDYLIYQNVSEDQFGNPHPNFFANECLDYAEQNFYVNAAEQLAASYGPNDPALQRVAHNVSSDTGLCIGCDIDIHRISVSFARCRSN